MCLRRPARPQLRHHVDFFERRCGHLPRQLVAAPPEQSSNEKDRWRRRPRLALLVRLVIFLAPAVMATDVSLIVSSLLRAPHGLPQLVIWWTAVLAASALALLTFDRLFRRLLPLTVLLDLALVFPGVAPSRFSAAFRAGSIRNLQRRIEQAKESDETGPLQAASTVVELIAALAVHDPRTRGHSERTRAYSDLVAEELGLSTGDRDRLRWSALLHDIGKLHVTASVLNKPGKPDPDEWEVLRQHPAEGARIAGGLRAWLGEWGLAIEQHHERFDGTGYPHSLSGNAISLGGRIVAVADAYEVMTSARTYTPPVAPQAAREELVRCAGNHFDPEIVRAFLRVALARFPRRGGLLVAFAQLPGLLRVEQVLQQAASALAAGAAVATLDVGGVVLPGDPGLGGSSGGGDVTDVATTAPGLTRSTGANPQSSLPTMTLVPSLTETATEVPEIAATAPGAPTDPDAAAASGSGYYLGGTAASGELRREPPTGTGAPDLDGDGNPGRTLLPSPQPATTKETAEHQTWVLQMPGGGRISGSPVLTVSSAVLGFGSGKGTLRAVLLNCEADGRSCLKRPITSGSLSQSEWSDGSGSFAVKTLAFSAADHVIDPGRSLVLRVGVQNGSKPLLVAYGTSSHPALLRLEII